MAKGLGKLDKVEIVECQAWIAESWGKGENSGKDFDTSEVWRLAWSDIRMKLEKGFFPSTLSNSAFSYMTECLIAGILRLRSGGKF